ncbi:glycosyltransferase family 9 protein [Streptomyces sp. HMX87]|uniref:glycosyltransferase family 9 protein n=1 Tax=Streptomyces sp. HMX87 TaxID=3390849 RepID=UPI003A8B6816
MKALVAHAGEFGDVLQTGPAVRAIANRAGRVTMLCGARGAPAARLLPHVDDVVTWETPGEGTAPAAPDGTGTDTDAVVRRLRREAYDVALVLTPERHDPLPLARLLRTARVGRIGAAGGGTADGSFSDDPLLDVRHPCRPGRPEAEAALGTALAMGFGLRTGDDGRLRVRPAPDTASLTGNGPYVVVHPGAGDPARAWDADRGAEAVALLCDAGHRVVVTGGADETALTRKVGGDTAVDLGGRTTARALAGVLRSADVLVTGSAGPAHLAAAVGTPVVSLSAPTAAPAPYQVPTACVDARGPADDVVRAVRGLLGAGV